MKIKKIAVILTAVASLTFGSQSAFANSNIYEQNDIQNNSYYTPELYTAGSVSTNPFGLNKLGTLSSTSDHDWYLLEIPQNFPSDTALITLVNPYGGVRYSLSITTENGGYVSKEWLIDNETLTQVRIQLSPNTKYKLHVSPYSENSDVNQFYYQLAVN
ncbi:hypothetical protein [Paenibacillus turpanensis]|uniref:hypothetical protein n=1 Tax=Paenibacillus turpanensis TaxID=2689078 RepID=UPI00140CE358|nr:hypothetical protein [Paenibacillus turpanensis]